MSELKSAWQLAQERANRLGRLSPEEQEQQKRQRCRQIGGTLARKWLDASQRLDITAELNKHEEKDRSVVKQSIIEHLVEAIEFTTTHGINSVKGIVEAISNLEPKLQPRAQEIHQLVQEYHQAEQKLRQRLETNYRENLHQLRISGTAVDAINIEAHPKWQLASQELVKALGPRLNDLKQSLISTP
jgi:predicted S18 family serine protease